MKNGDVLARIVAFVLPLGLDTLAIAIALGLQGQIPLQPALLFVVFAVGFHMVREAQHRKNEVQRFALDSLRGIILERLSRLGAAWVRFGQPQFDLSTRRRQFAARPYPPPGLEI